MPAHREPRSAEASADDEAIVAIQSALHSLGRRLVQARLRNYIARQADSDLDPAGIAVLAVLYEEQISLRITDLAAKLGIDAPAVTRKAQQLERRNLVSRSRDPDDARASRLSLTPEGHRILEQFLRARHQWLTALLADWPPAEAEEFARLISRFADDIDRHLETLDG